ncbi:C4b-binding protein alpha chain-like isoform X2 [Hyla sarda]|uniref:C4b-binding protein alpha chain-like isoform X2 n=1 Tax=Hyla sarda TaxID=327740 RepID=UPI0024C3E854|nr:C4b-binding protein alpha chain-like isoform X2 [Hyla sarda]
MARRLHPLTLTWLLLGLGDVREGAGQCRRPSGEGMIPADRESYNVGESVTVRCGIGYRPSPERVTCLNPKTRNGWDQTGQCIGQCRRPAMEGMIPVDKDFYNVGESIIVRCEAGYRSLHERTTCTSRQPNDVWDNPPMCIAQCRKPPIGGLISAYKEFYEVGESLPVQCRTGYWPSHERTYCANPHSGSEWDPSSRCIGNNGQVIGDNNHAQCRKPQIEGLISAYKEFYEVGESLPVQCRTGYWPSHERTYCANPYSGSEWDPSSRCIGNNSQVIGDNNHGQCKKPQISDTVYLIPGDESSYAVGQSLTVQCAPGHHPAQETITCVRFHPGPRTFQHQLGSRLRTLHLCPNIHNKAAGTYNSSENTVYADERRYKENMDGHFLPEEK